MRVFSFLRSVVAALLHRSRTESEMDEELRAHLEDRANDLEGSGVPRAEAERRARLEFGGYQKFKEECRDATGVTFFESLAQDVRYGLRMLRKSPGFTIVAVLTLALGIGGTTAIFTLMDALLLRFLPVSRPHQLVLLNWYIPSGKSLGPRAASGDFWEEKSQSFGTPFSYRSYQDFRKHGDIFSDVFAFVDLGDHVDVTAEGVAGLAHGQIVSGNYFLTLGLHPAEGRLIDEGDDQANAAPVCVVSDRWRNSRFARHAAILGKTVKIAGAAFTIVGVAPPEFFGLRPGSAVDVWVPLSAQPLLATNEAPGVPYFSASNYWWLSLVARLKSGITPERAISRADVIFKQSVSQDVPRDTTGQVAIPTLAFMPVGKGLDSLRRQFSRPLFILMGLVSIVLLIACANVANLLLARGATRQAEMRVRLSLGPSRTRIFRQLLTESVLLASLGAALGLAFSLWGSSILVAFVSSPQNPVQLDAAPDWMTLVFTASVSVVTGLLFGLAPAFRAIRAEATPALGERAGRGATSAPRLKVPKLLVVAQTSLSLILVFGAALFVRTLINLKNVALGFDENNLLLFGINAAKAGYRPAQLNKLYADVRRRSSILPGVVSVTASRFLLLGGSATGGSIWVPGFVPRAGESANARMLPVAPSFFTTMRIPLLRGRDFSERDDAQRQKVAIVNQIFVNRFFGQTDPIGRRVGDHEGKADIEIVGVVADANYTSLREGVTPTIYKPVAQVGSAWMYFEVRTKADPRAVIPAVRSVVTSLAPDVPIFGMKTQREQIDESLLQERLFAKLSGFFGILALGLACLGQYGVFSYAVVRRTHEIGIRMALGARSQNIVLMIARESLLLILGGVFVGIPAALIIARVLASTISDLLYRVKVTDLQSIVVAGGALLITGTIAAVLPARRAMRVDPMVAVRYE